MFGGRKSNSKKMSIIKNGNPAIIKNAPYETKVFNKPVKNLIIMTRFSPQYPKTTYPKLVSGCPLVAELNEIQSSNTKIVLTILVLLICFFLNFISKYTIHPQY